jgi:hypothetical protein
VLEFASIARTVQLLAMRLRTCTRGLVAGAISVSALAASAGVAQADPDPFAPSPGIIDLITTETPAIFVDPADEGGPSTGSGGVGMYCENLLAHCQ